MKIAQATTIHHHFRRFTVKNFSKIIFLGLAASLFNPAIADDALKGGGYKNSGSDFPRHVTSSPSPRAPVTAQDNHHNDGGQDRSGRDWTKDVIAHDRQHPADASSSRSLQEWGWNSK